MKTIEKDSIEKLIKNHGILLEHQTENTISSYLRKQDDCEIISSDVSHRIYSNVKQEYVEIDVFTEVKKKYPRMILKTKSRSASHTTDLERYSLYTNIIFLVQCKGHPSNGFLLCRSVESQDQNYSETMIDKMNDLEMIVMRKGVNIVDWSFFYKINEGKTKQLKNEIVYQEDSDKFYKGIEQINQSLSTYFETYSETYHPQENNIVKIIPLIVTNSPIRLMKIEKSEVMIHDVPWVTKLNYHKPDGNIITDEFYENYFKFIHVVQYSELEKFLEIILDIKKDFSYPEKYINTFHSFII